MYTLVKYTTREINNFKNGKVKILKNENDIINFVSSAQIEHNNSKLFYGKIGKRLANKIFKETSVFIYNFHVSLQLYSVQHIIKKHNNIEKEKLRGQINITSNDFRFIAKIIANYDYIELSGLTNCNNPVIIFIHENYVLVCFVSFKNHTLEVKTLWRRKKNSVTVS